MLPPLQDKDMCNRGPSKSKLGSEQDGTAPSLLCRPSKKNSDENLRQRNSGSLIRVVLDSEANQTRTLRDRTRSRTSVDPSAG